MDEIDMERARNAGRMRPDQAWILTPLDKYVRNPFYRGSAPQPARPVEPADPPIVPAEWRAMCPVEAWCGERPCALQRFIFTTGLLVDVQFEGAITYGYRARYCYEHYADALQALFSWDGQGDPPGPWIKEKRSGRLGPGAKP